MKIIALSSSIAVSVLAGGGHGARGGYAAYNLASSTGGYGIGSYGVGQGTAYALQSSSGGGAGIGGYQSYGLGSLGQGTAFALQSSSGGGAAVGGYQSYGLQLPALPNIGHGHGHKKHHQPIIQQPVIEQYVVAPKVQQYVAPRVEQVEVEEFVSTDGPVLENQVNSYSSKKKYAVTHRPVYHKTVYNHYTAHDTINKDVYHHIGEKEARRYDVAGKTSYGGATQINHGDKGHAAYASIVGARGISAPSYRNLGAKQLQLQQPSFNVQALASSSQGSFIQQPSFNVQSLSSSSI